MNMKFIKDDIEVGQIIQKILGYALKIGIQDPNHYGIFEICAKVPDLILLSSAERITDGEYKSGWGHYEVIGNK